MRYNAVVLAGGAARRLGGRDKAAVEVGGRRLLDRVLAASAGAERVVVVGPERPTLHTVTWTREQPPGGGPVAALAAALPLTDSEIVAVLAVDLPLVTVATVERLVAAARQHDGALLVDGQDREQLLLAAYRRGALVARCQAIRAAARTVASAPMRRLVGGLDLVRLPDEGAALDCDTWDDVERAREEIERGAR